MLPLVLFFIFISCYFVYGWPFRPHPPAGAGGGRCLSRTTLKILCSSPTWHTARNAASARFNVGLNATTRAQLSGEGPQESLATFIEWVLVSYKSPLTVDIVDTSPTLDPSPHSPSLSSPLTESQSQPRDIWAIAWESNRADDSPRACDIRPGAKAGNRARHGGEHQVQREHREKLHPLYHGWG